MKPFATSNSTPWKATTPETRTRPGLTLEAEDPPLPPSPILSKPPAGNSESTGSSLDTVKKLLGGKMTKEIEEAIKAAEGSTAPVITQSLMHKVSNAQRAAQKAKEKVMKLDQDWQEFQNTLQLRYEEQKQAYVAQRGEAVTIYHQKKERLQELKQELQKATHSPPARTVAEPDDAIDVPDLQLLPPEAVNLTDDEMEEPTGVPNSLRPFGKPPKRPSPPEESLENGSKAKSHKQDQDGTKEAGS